MDSLMRFVPGTWPVGHLVLLLTSNPTKPEAKLKDGAIKAFSGKPYYTGLLDHIALQVACIPRFIVALLCMASLNTAIQAAANGVPILDWVVPLLVRDLAITWCTASFWDFLLYSQYSPVSAAAKPYKFNPTYPKFSQFGHDAFWSTMSTIMSTAFEAAFIHFVWKYTWTQEAAAAPWWNDWRTLFWLFTMPYWRIAHFYTVHRLMHKWNIPGIPDIGMWLYINVHSLHHKSKNPISWSGVSMHPVESAAYYSAMLIPLLGGAHPLVSLYTKVDETMAALIGHDGFGSPPGSGSQSHYLHHAYIDCNYGESYVPLDWLMGTFVANEEEYMARKSAAETKRAKKA